MLVKLGLGFAEPFVAAAAAEEDHESDRGLLLGHVYVNGTFQAVESVTSKKLSATGE